MVPFLFFPSNHEQRTVFFSSKSCRLTSFRSKTDEKRIFDVYSSTEIVLLTLDTFVMFVCFACAVTGGVACSNKGRYYYDKDDEIDQLYYKYIEEGGDLQHDPAEPLLSGESNDDDVHNEEDLSNHDANQSSDNIENEKHTSSKTTSSHVGRKKRRTKFGSAVSNRRTISGRKSGEKGKRGNSIRVGSDTMNRDGGHWIDDHGDFGQQSNSDFYTTDQISDHDHVTSFGDTDHQPPTRIDRTKQQQEESRKVFDRRSDEYESSSGTDDSEEETPPQ